MPDRYLGRTIGKYRVTRLLGAGAYSWVYEAVDQDLEIPVALKVLRPEFAGQDAAEIRFKREAATAARLRHPNIVTVRDVGQVDGAAFVAMDLHPLTLGRRLSLMGRLPETEVVRLGLGIAAALATAHASGVIHRDIKPDNILLDADGEAVVADFGLARALAGASSISATNQVLGTPQYFSPEQARGLELDGRSDLYALGVTLFRAATGKLPFDGEDWYAVARQHIEVPAPSPRSVVPELTPEFDALVLRLLAKEPGDRFANAVQAVDALAALPTAPERSVNLPRLASHTIEAFRLPGKRRTSWAAALVLVLLLGLVGWLLTRGGVGLPVIGQRVDSAMADTAAPQPVAVTPIDSTQTIDSARAAAARPTLPAGTRPPRVTPKQVTLELSASDSAELYLNNRQVGTGRFAGDVDLSDRLELHAVVADAPTSCRTARRDTVLSGLKAGEHVAITFAVRGCVPVRYNVQPRDARVLFQSLDGGPNIETRADSAISVLVPIGRYVLRATAPRCIAFSDTIVVQRGGSADAKPLKMFCPQ
ncbi:MAG: serine/threonine protein kinase [Gemmatimonadaceae bacterium]|nr:serine/threonine protein kinase [Gemmatimonadaceae bacterium]